MDNKTFQNIHKEEQDLIQGDSSHWIMLSNIGMTLPSILVVLLFVGSWGDRVRFKPMVLILLFCYVQNFIELTLKVVPDVHKTVFLVSMLDW